jgi:serine/threonine protein kinase
MPQSWIGKTIGDRYRIEALLGQGGMSAVYKATDPNLRRVVAIKLIHAHLSEDPNFVGRFKEEAAAVASLRHANIVQVHDFNVDSGTYYMVMEYLVGETLQRRLKRLNASGRTVPLDEALRLCIQICEAAGYAHDHEMVHRDIKPANIMINVNGQAILMDFGIVKIMGGEYHTATGATIGTAMYMSPEQIRSERVDERADIYSLGVTLYEMLSGQPPYAADSALTLMMMVLNDPLPDLRQARKGIPESLWAAVQKALAKEPAGRFQTMAEMATALRQVQVALTSAPPTPTTTQVSENVVVPTTTAIAGDTLTEVEIAETLQPGQQAPVTPAAGVQKVKDKASSATTVQDTPAEAAVMPAPIESPNPRVTTRKVKRPIVLAAIGLLILAIAVVSGGLYLNARKPPKLQLIPINRPAIPVNAQTAQQVVSLGRWEIGSSVQALIFSPDSSLLGTANERYEARFSKYRFFSGLWQVQPGRLQTYLLGHEMGMVDADFSPDGQIFGSASDDNVVMLWQVADGGLMRKIESPYGGLTSLDFSPNNLLLATGSWDGVVSLYQVSDGNLLRTFQQDYEAISDVNFSSDGTLLAAGSKDNSILLWRVSDGSLTRALQGHSAPVLKAVFSPDGSLLASTSEDYTIKIWQVSDGSLLHSTTGYTETVIDIAFSPDGSMLASATDGGKLSLWKVSDGSLLRTLNENLDDFYNVAFSSDGYLLVSGSVEGIVQFWGISEAIPLEEK